MPATDPAPKVRSTTKRPYRAESETLGDHVAAGFVSAIAILLTVVLLPVLVATLGEGGDWHDLHAEYRPARIWFALLVGGGFVLGLVLGPRKTMHFFGYLWFTEEPQRPWLTIALWACIAILMRIGFNLSS